MQHLGAGPLTALLPEGTEIWLDGAHNIDAGLALARQFKGEPRRIHLITGMLANKDPAAVIAPLADRLASLTVVPVPRSEEHTSELQSLMRISYAVFCLKKQKRQQNKRI